MNTKLIDQIMVTLRQDRPCKEGLKRILPQRIEGGAIYSALDVFITQAPKGTEDMVFFEKEEVLKTSRVTDALLNRIFKPINEFLRENREPKEPEQEEEPEETEEPEEEEEVSDTVADEIMELIENGKLKKAKKLLKKHKDDLDKKTVKALKKLIKEGENDG